MIKYWGTTCPTCPSSTYVCPLFSLFLRIQRRGPTCPSGSFVRKKYIYIYIYTHTRKQTNIPTHILYARTSRTSRTFFVLIFNRKNSVETLHTPRLRIKGILRDLEHAIDKIATNIENQVSSIQGVGNSLEAAIKKLEVVMQ